MEAPAGRRVRPGHIGLLAALACIVVLGPRATSSFAAPPPPTTTTTVGTVAPAAATAITGVLRDAATGAGLQNGCVAALAVGSPGSPTINNISFDGTWSIDPGATGDYHLAFYTTGTGNCSDPIASTPVPSWYLNQALTGNNPNNITPPPTAQAVPTGSSGIVACLSTTGLATGCAQPITQLSGTVYTVGHVPVAKACVFIIPPRGNVSGTITDSQGRWSVNGLPIGTSLVVGVVPPFTGPNGPCTTSNGPPPAPPTGQLQPVFYKDIWIDLTSPSLQDAYTYALTLGATPFTRTTTGISVCLSTAPGSVVPRPSCDPPTPAATTTVPLPTPAPIVIIPPTGRSERGTVTLAIGAIALGLAALVAARRRSDLNR